MVVRATPADFVDFDLHRAFIIVPHDALDFMKADFVTADDAKTWWSERGLPVVAI
jgi:hypothetical protein